MHLRREQLQELRLIQTCPKHLRKQLLQKLPLKTVKTICECVFNTLRGNVKLTSHQKKRLAKYKYTLRKVGSRQGTLYTKKRLIAQRGGFLNILIPAAVTALSALINGI